MPQFLFALLLTLSTDTANLDTRQNELTWIHGRWLQVAVAADTTPGVVPKLQKKPGKKHLLLFRPDGEVRRYSPRKGWDRLRLDFLVSKDSVTLSHQNRDHFSLAGEKTAEGLLKVCIPRYGDFYYKKIHPQIQIEEIDFILPPTHSPEQPITQRPEP
ncbi:hypothetical protein [Desulfoluna sp.]|uniref:hypothetical protein n=1 Tax=Desulfoluna sp. TaxID=2045199 RepID=UPI00262449EE|nr:hypothetical protein [Desulfoluna sp.]